MELPWCLTPELRRTAARNGGVLHASTQAEPRSGLGLNELLGRSLENKLVVRDVGWVASDVCQYEFFGWCASGARSTPVWAPFKMWLDRGIFDCERVVAEKNPVAGINQINARRCVRSGNQCHSPATHVREVELFEKVVPVFHAA